MRPRCPWRSLSQPQAGFYLGPSCGLMCSHHTLPVLFPCLPRSPSLSVSLSDPSAPSHLWAFAHALSGRYALNPSLSIAWPFHLSDVCLRERERGLGLPLGLPERPLGHRLSSPPPAPPPGWLNHHWEAHMLTSLQCPLHAGLGPGPGPSWRHGPQPVSRGVLGEGNVCGRK